MVLKPSLVAWFSSTLSQKKEHNEGVNVNRFLWFRIEERIMGGWQTRDAKLGTCTLIRFYQVLQTSPQRVKHTRGKERQATMVLIGWSNKESLFVYLFQAFHRHGPLIVGRWCCCDSHSLELRSCDLGWSISLTVFFSFVQRYKGKSSHGSTPE